ncbi:MAG: Unknown protein [uncultured Campylobacterales bacterium]|uniref:DUF481 domain-containing protein n=1 Tax=uncultured Campylobacterales bacterium TaxID=352960 RepID=A0A6S6T0Y7_9BACT|nr:MAG: Unknown protein [uncultured Campylobacterales bacterium]
MKKMLLISACTAMLLNAAEQNLEVGFVNTNGNTKTTNLNAKYILKNSFSDIDYTFDIGTFSSKAEGETTAENYFANLNVEEEISNGWLGYAKLGWEKDRFRGFEGRYTAGLGVGKILLEDETQKLDIKIGLSYNHDHFTNDLGSSSYGALNESINYTNKLSETSDFYASVSSWQNLDDISDDYEVKSIAGVKYRLSTNLSLNAEINVDYDALPVPDTEKTDTKTIVKLSYSF